MGNSIPSYFYGGGAQGATEHLVTNSEATFTVGTFLVEAATSVDIDWGDGNQETFNAGDANPVTHDYSGSGSGEKTVTFSNGVENITVYK